MLREVESCNHVLAAMITFFNHLLTLHSWSENGNLFPVQEHSPEDILERSRTINQFAFYGRCLGFHYAESIKPIMKFIAISMASFSESYYSNNGTFIKATNSMFTSGKYLLDPELRSRRIVGLSQNSSVDFCKVKRTSHSCF
jgi:hormone-sensitive lipase